MQTKSATRYSTVQMGLHWGIAALVLFQIVFGEAMTRAVDAAEEGGAVASIDALLASAHFWSGLAILGLVLVRLVVRVTRGAPPHLPQTQPILVLAANALHWLFYALLVAVPVSGLLTYYGVADLGEIHGLAKPVFIVLVALHAGAALFHQFVLRDGTMSRMVPARPDAAL